MRKRPRAPSISLSTGCLPYARAICFTGRLTGAALARPGLWNVGAAPAPADGHAAADDGHGDDGHGDDGHGEEHEEDHFRDFGIGVFVLALSFGIVARSASAGARLVDKSTAAGR